jgi:hypothetical protein
VRSCPTEGWTVGIYIEWPSEFFLMPHFDRELIEVMRDALEEAMAKVPWEYSTSATKAYLAECILKTAAQGQISRNELVAAAADQIQAAITLCPCHRAPSDDCSRFIQQAAALREIARPFIDKFRELRGLSTEQDPTNSVVVGARYRSIRNISIRSSRHFTRPGPAA